MPTETVFTDDALLGYTEIAELNSVVPKTIMNYHSSAKLKGYPSNMMPPPDDVSYGDHPLWRWDTIRAWMERRRGSGGPVYNFSVDQVAQMRTMRNANESRQRIAETFGVNPQVVARVLGEPRVPRDNTPTTPETMRKVRELYAKGTSIAALCRQFGLSREKVKRALGQSG